MIRTQRVHTLPTVLADRYEIGEAVGSGGVAIVFRAYDRKHDRSVAIKVLRPDLASSITVERFLREIRFAAQLQHPHILPLHDSGEVDGLPYYVMPLIEGETLRDRLTREKQLPIGDAVRFVREAADALHFAHERGIVHRDIKPENLLLSAGHVLVADFGIARAISKADSGKLTDTGTAIGTPSYMSPEQSFTGDVDARSDVYSLACVLYELLVGEPPSGSLRAGAFLARQSAGALPSMRGVRPSIPQALEAVVSRALETDPTARFQSAGALSEALAQASPIDSVAPPTRVAPHSERVRELLRRRRRRFAVVGSLGLLVVAAVVKLVWTPHGDRDSPASGLDPKTIAVLYLTPEGSDSLRYVADALTETLIRRLSTVDSIRVISPNGVRQFRGKSVGTDSVARAFEAGLVVRAAISSVSGALRLDMALIEGISGKIVARDSVRRPREEIVALQDDATLRLSGLLQRRLGQEIRTRERERQTKNLRAWSLYYHGRALSNDVESLPPDVGVDSTRRNRHLADSLWSLAALEDPTWPAPLVGRSWLALKEFAASQQSPRIPLLDSGIALANDALSRSPGDATALEMRGTLRYLRWGRISRDSTSAALVEELKDAEADFRAAIAANPKAAWAWSYLSLLLMNSGQTRQSEAAARRAYAVDPYGPNVKNTLDWAFTAALEQRDAGDARRLCAVFGRRFPADYRFPQCQLWLYSLKGQKPNVADMWTTYREFVNATPRATRAWSALWGQMLVALGLARADLADSARHVAIRARGDSLVDPSRSLLYYEALVRTALGDKDEAFRLLQEDLRWDPRMFDDEDVRLEDLWSDPRWHALRAVKR